MAYLAFGVYIFLMPSLCTFNIILIIFKFQLILVSYIGIIVIFRKAFHCYSVESEQEV